MENSSLELIRQWAQQVTKFSSQYGCPSWQASNICGAPRVFPQHGDNALAWAAAPKGTKEFIEFSYERAVIPSEIIIYETYHAGGIATISARDEYGQWMPIYKAQKIENITESRKLVLSTDPAEGESRLLSLPSDSFAVKELRIDIDQTVCSDWVEIDAVELVGYQVKHVDPIDNFTAYFNSVFEEMLTGKQTHFSDVTFELIDGSQISAQRIILARNDYFKDLFEKHPHHATIKASVGKDLFELLLRHCYTNKFPSDNCDMLVELATRHSVTFCIPASGMRTLLLRIQQLLSPKNVATYWWRAHTANEKEMDAKAREKLLEMCIAFTAQQFDAVANDAGHFSLFNREDLLEFMAQVGARIRKTHVQSPSVSTA